VLVRHDETQIQPLQDVLLDGELGWVEPISTRLRLYSATLRPSWLSLLRDQTQPATRRFRVALALVKLDEGQATIPWTNDDLVFIAKELTGSRLDDQKQLRELLRPLAKQLLTPLRTLFDTESSNTNRQINLAHALADYAKDHPTLLADTLTRANPLQAEILYPEVSRRFELVRDHLKALTARQPNEKLSQFDRIRLGQQRANAAIALLRLGQRDSYFEALRTTDDPESLSQFVHRCRSWGVTPQELLESFKRCENLRGWASGAAKRLEARVMYALLLALGNYSLEEIPEESQAELLDRLRVLYAEDPAAAVHSASGWLLRRWGFEKDLRKLDESEVPYDPDGKRDWFRVRVCVAQNDAGESQFYSLTFIVFPRSEYRLDGNSRVEKLSRPFALCDREVTWELYDAFDGEIKHALEQEDFGELNSNVPASSVSWVEWVLFCRWLTTKYRGGDEQWQCYKDPSGNDEKLLADQLLADRGGFRMPIELEWEVGTRSGTQTDFSFGGDKSLLTSYGWFLMNAGERPLAAATKMPGPGGLYDAHGSLSEWVDDSWAKKDIHTSAGPTDASDDRWKVTRGGSWADHADACNVVTKGRFPPVESASLFGFRLALSPAAFSVQAEEAGQNQN
jgi:hypothetical protein